MAFRRKAAEEVGCFDESIQYGFDEVEFTERVCRAGYKMVLDPNVFVWHKHRSTLKEFLKQNFRYGRGSGLLLKRKRMKMCFHMVFSKSNRLHNLAANSWVADLSDFYNKLEHFSPTAVWIYNYTFTYHDDGLRL